MATTFFSFRTLRYLRLLLLSFRLVSLAITFFFHILYFFNILLLSLSTRMSSRTALKDHSSPLPVVRGSDDCYYAKYANRFKSYSSVTRASLERCELNFL